MPRKADAWSIVRVSPTLWSVDGKFFKRHSDAEAYRNQNKPKPQRVVDDWTVQRVAGAKLWTVNGTMFTTRKDAVAFRSAMKPKPANDKAEAFFAALGVYASDVPAPSKEYFFAKPRLYRFDGAWIPQRVAVEIDGGQWVANGGRHNRDSDREKLNIAAALGWRVLRFSTQQIGERGDILGCIKILRHALAWQGDTNARND